MVEDVVLGPAAELSPEQRVAVAFDVESPEAALDLRRELSDALALVKIGSALFVRSGMPLVHDFKRENLQVFLDLKFHDIPSVVARAVEHAASAGVDYLTVHAAGGPAMIESAVRAAEREGSTRVLAVTVLTSLDRLSWAHVSPGESQLADAVTRLARVAHNAGAHGFVGSAREATLLREVGRESAWIVTPGIQVPGIEVPDQSRTVTAEEALRSGADLLVVGRGVRTAPNPRACLLSIHDTIREVSA